MGVGEHRSLGAQSLGVGVDKQCKQGVEPKKLQEVTKKLLISSLVELPSREKERVGLQY